MVELREAVYAADKANGDVEAALRALRSHVYGHMNTNLSSGANAVYPPLQLKYTYERLQDTAQEQARQANQQIYTEAQADCERRYPESYSGGPRVPCIRDYVAARGVQVQTVPDELYKFNFVSPTWSPDLAGWSILLTGVVGVLVIIRISLPIILKRQNVL